MAVGSAAEKPRYILWAVVATVVNAVVGVIFAVAWPDLEDRGTIVVVSIVIAALMVGFSLWLWRGSRWGAIGVLAINAFNILLGLPGYFTGEGDIMVGITISVVLSVAAIVLLLLPEGRAFWSRRA
jgi:hypothetical protein